jgi:hypothetical protein
MAYLEYSQSVRAAQAKAQGKWPATWAAKELGISLKAFKLGIRRAGIEPCEWHHTSKFFKVTDFYDVEECRDSWKFWLGAAKAYKGRARQRCLENALEAIKHWKQLGDEDAKYRHNRKSPLQRFLELCEGKLRKDGLIYEALWRKFFCFGRCIETLSRTNFLQACREVLPNIQQTIEQYRSKLEHAERCLSEGRTLRKNKPITTKEQEDQIRCTINWCKEQIQLLTSEAEIVSQWLKTET